MKKRGITEMSEGSEEKSPKRVRTVDKAEEERQSTYGFTAEQVRLLAAFAFCNKRCLSRLNDADGTLLKKVAQIFRVLSFHKTVESSILWRMLADNVYCAFSDDDLLLKLVAVLFGDGPDQVSLVDMMRFEFTMRHEDLAMLTLTLRGGDEVEEWMLAEFARLLPLAPAKDVAVMINSLSLTCSAARTSRFLEMIDKAERFSKFAPLSEVLNELEKLLPTGGVYTNAIECRWKIRDLCDLRA